MAGIGNILIKVGADAGQAVRELSTVDKALGSTQTTSEKMGAGLKKAALPAAAALGAIGVAAIGATKAAAEDAAAADHLAGVMERTAGATKATVKQTEDWISSTSRATGVADDELRPAMETLVTATGDVGKAQKEMTAALDISAASGKSVEEVSKAMALAHTGQTAKLEKLIPGLSEASKKSDDMSTIMGELANKTGGAMAKSTETAAGQMKIMKNQTAELQETMGYALLPVMEAILPIFVKLADFASKNTTVMEILIGVVAGLAAAVLIANAAMKLYAVGQAVVTAATWLWNAALSANPIGIVVIALAALGVALVIAYKKSETFRRVVGDALDVVKGAVDAVRDAFNKLKTTVVNVFDWITDHWKLALFAFGPIGAAVYVIATNFDAIKETAQDAYRFVTSHWNIAEFALGPIKTAVDAIADAFKRIDQFAGNAWSTIKAFIKWMGDNFKIPELHFPKPPKWMHLPGTTLAMPAVAGARAGTTAAAASGGGAGLTINVYGAVDPEGTARSIRRLLEAHDRRQGRLR